MILFIWDASSGVERNERVIWYGGKIISLGAS